MTSPAWADVTLPDLIIDGLPITEHDWSEAVTDAKFVRSIEHASTTTFTVFDPDHKLLNSKILTTAIRCHVDQHAFQLVSVDKQDDDILLTFEDDAVAMLRKHAVPMKAARKKLTRAQFVKRMTDEEKKLTLYCPELKIKQPIDPTGLPKKPKGFTTQQNREPGFPNKIPGGMTLRGGPVTQIQLANINAMLIQGSQTQGIDDFVLLTAIAVVIDEDAGRNSPIKRDSTSVGMFQMLDMWGTVKQRLDIAFASNWFFSRAIPLHKAHPDYTVTELAHAVQGNKDPNVYAQWVPEAKKVFALWTGVGELPTSAPATHGPYEFHRGGPGHRGEDSWQAILRLAEEVHWFAFTVGYTVYFISQKDLYTSKPIATIDHDTPGIENIDFQFDTGKILSQAQVTAHAMRWQVDPGAVVILENCGPANGRWIVSEIARSFYDTNATISLVKPTRALPEPVSEVGLKARKVTANKLVVVGELSGNTAVAVGIGMINPNGYLLNANHPGITLKQVLDGKRELPPFDCSSFVRWLWLVGGHVDIGDTNVAGQVAHAKTTSWRQGTLKPAGGFLPGDILSLHGYGHTVMCAGNGQTIEAMGRKWGILQSTMPDTWDYWYRPVPAGG